MDNEQNPEITALANGGFMVVYEFNGADNDLHYRTFDAAGLPLLAGDILNDAAGGAVPNNPVVASATATSAMMAYVVNNADGSESVYAVSYNPTTNILGTPVLHSNLPVDGIALTALSNNNFALAIANNNGVGFFELFNC